MYCTHDEYGMGQTQNIARSSTDAVRSFYTSLQTRVPQPVAPAPSPWPTVGRTTTFVPTPAPTPTRTVTPTLPVLTYKPPVVSAPKPITPVIVKPTVSVAPAAGPGVTVSMAPAPAGSILTSGVAGGLDAFGKSPLPLILIGLVSLFVLNKKGR